MFRFDSKSLPRIVSGKALIAVDLQNDFLSSDGALTIENPNGLACQVINLANQFRSIGSIVWVKTEFKDVRPEYEDTILVTENSAELHHNRDGNCLPIDPEAFLSSVETSHPLSSTTGTDMPQNLQAAVQKDDIFITKSHYSSFEDTTLLRLLRGRMVMDVVICGSLINVGVYATALAAAGHGMNITIVEDCCGYRSDERRRRAMKTLLDLLGCTFTTSDALIGEISAGSELATRNDPAQHPIASNRDIVNLMSTLGLSQPAPPLAPICKANSKAVMAKQQQSAQMATELSGTLSKPLETSNTIESREFSPYNNQLSSDNATKSSQNSSSLPTPTPHLPATLTTNMTPQLENGPVPPKFHAKGLCEGDTDVIGNVLPEKLAGEAFQRLQDEVDWQRMSHQGGDVPRLVAVQGEVAEDGSFPVYRHPSDESPKLLPFSPTVLAIKSEVEQYLGHSLNHVLIQRYRDGNDYISEHSDKTLDISPSTYIANVSLGAQRTMVLRTKRMDKDPSFLSTQSGDQKRQIQRAELPHNSLCRMGLQTNMKWLHSIRQDKRSVREKTQAELDFSGERISLTFRHIGTYLSSDQKSIWGQGACGKHRSEAGQVVNGQSAEAIKLLRAFGTENRSSTFDWNAFYGAGFNVLHFQNSPRFFASTLEIVDLPIVMMLHEYGIGYAGGSVSSKDDGDNSSERVKSASEAVKYIDNDLDKSSVQGDTAIMLYLHSASQNVKERGTGSITAQNLSGFQQAHALRQKWLSLKDSNGKGRLSSLQNELEEWNNVFAESSFCSGGSPSLPDFLLWPILEDITRVWGAEAIQTFSHLRQFWQRMGEREAVVRALQKVGSRKDGLAS